MTTTVIMGPAPCIVCRTPLYLTRGVGSAAMRQRAVIGFVLHTPARCHPEERRPVPIADIVARLDAEADPSCPCGGYDDYEDHALSLRHRTWEHAYEVTE